MSRHLRYDLLGVAITPLTMTELHDVIVRTIEEDKQLIAANHNLHSVYLCNHDVKMRAFYRQAEISYIDGMPLVLFGWLKGMPFRRSQRLTTLDWMPPLLYEIEKRKWRIFFLGSRPGVAEKAIERLRTTHPDLDIAHHHGYFDPDRNSPDNKRVVEQIVSYKPHILLLGMGMPRQEHWIADNVSALSVNVIMNLGAYMDYVAGEVPTPPRWMGRVGLEWLFRLLGEPDRLWRRYLVEPWYILVLLMKEMSSGVKE